MPKSKIDRLRAARKRRLAIKKAQLKRLYHAEMASREPTVDAEAIRDIANQLRKVFRLPTTSIAALKRDLMEEAWVCAAALVEEAVKRGGFGSTRFVRLRAKVEHARKTYPGPPDFVGMRMISAACEELTRLGYAKAHPRAQKCELIALALEKELQGQVMEVILHTKSETAVLPSGELLALKKEQARILAQLIHAAPGWISSKQMKVDERSSERPDLIIKRMPEAIRSLIESKSGAGSRLKIGGRLAE